MIERRRAASSYISSEKKISGHRNEELYASLIDGQVLHGTQKGDVKDKKNSLHSVKSGKKWQVFLYGYERIKNSKYLNILEPCLSSFTNNSHLYFKDRIDCISYKENYLKIHGKEETKNLLNDTVISKFPNNSYIEAKFRLQQTTQNICNTLKDKIKLRDFLDEAVFNFEVEYLAVRNSPYIHDNKFRVFRKKDVLDILSENLYPETSKAGNVPQDFNVSGQKTLLQYNKNGRLKNIVEIEIRNDSPVHYRQVRFNMYSEDFMYLLLRDNFLIPQKNDEVIFFVKNNLS